MTGVVHYCCCRMLLRNNFVWRSLRSQIRFCSSVRYKEVYKRSVEYPKEFWAEQAAELQWTKPWKEILDTDSSTPASLWFKGGEVNVCENALDVHVQNGRGDQAAIIFQSNYSDTRYSLSYADLLDKVSKFSG